ncbi:MAG: acyl-CoA dehydrogenase family protein [Pseudobacteriovorax sp.]|nr:acyl-CoA dehydrogenase family protein [Pseudobacteriovorax sp.]
MAGGSNFFKDNPDIHNNLTADQKFATLFDLLSDEEKEAIGADSAQEYESMWLEMLDSVGDFAGGQLADNSLKVDKEDLKLEDGVVKNPPSIQSNIQTFIELGMHALSLPHSRGGMSAPFLVEFVGNELLARACPSTLLAVSWYGPIANIIELFGSDEIKDQFIPALATAELSGSMALTEPDVGSDLANMRSYSEKQDDGTYKLYGSKQFISNGGGGLSLVITQNKKGAKGLKSINLFVVPQHLEGKPNYTVTKIEEKPGLHGSATCALRFDGSKGWLLGKDGEGFSYMLHLMNEARIAVGFQALGLMEACSRLSSNYANEREAWGKPIARHEQICEKILDMNMETKVFRGLCYRAAYISSLVQLLERRIEDNALGEDKTEELQAQLKSYSKTLREWTPLIKWWAGERSYTIARNTVQIHGGYGFTKEYEAERWVRESLILSIYEGTSEIQALMCIKDTLKSITKNPRRFTEDLFATRMKSLTELDPTRRKYYKIKSIYQNGLLSVVLKMVKNNAKTKFNMEKTTDILNLFNVLKEITTEFDDLAPALLNASRICEMKAIVALSKNALENASISDENRELSERFINRYYPIMLKNKAELEWDDEAVYNACEA